MKGASTLTSPVTKASHSMGIHNKASVLIGHVILALHSKDSLMTGPEDTHLVILDNVLIETSRVPCIHLGTTEAGKMVVDLMR